MKITNSVEKNGYPQLIQDCNASTIKEILERVLHSITGKFDSATCDTIEKSSEITISSNFTAEHVGSAEIGTVLKLCALCDLRGDTSLDF